MSQLIDFIHESSSQRAGKNKPSSIWIFISLGGDNTKSQSNKKQTFPVTLSFFQGISYSNELKLRFITVQSEWTNKNTITRSTCLMRAILKDPKRRQTPDFLRFKMNQQYRIIVIIFITLFTEAACQSHTFNITEYNRHEKANGL